MSEAEIHTYIQAEPIQNANEYLLQEMQVVVKRRQMMLS